MVSVPARDVDRLLASRSGGAFLVFGEDSGLVEEHVRAIVRASVADSDDPMQVTHIASEQLSDAPGLLADEWNSIGMFQPKRAIVFEAGARDSNDALRFCVETPNPDCTLIVRAGGLRRDSPLRQLFERQKGAFAIECVADREADIEKLVRKTFADAQIAFDSAILPLLVDVLGADRAMSRGELEKLVLYIGEGGEVTESDVHAVVTDAAPRFSELAAAAVLSGNTADATTQGARTLATVDANQLLMTGLRAALSFHRAVAEVAEGTSEKFAMERAGRSLGARGAPRVALGQRNPEALRRVVTIMDEAISKVRHEPALAELYAMRALWSSAARMRRS